MKIETNSIDYGIYIDREKAFIIALDRIMHEALVSDTTLEYTDQKDLAENASQQEHIQNRKNEVLKRFCKSVIEKVINANNIVVFGPSTSKFELQKDIHHVKRLKNVKEQIATTDFMDKDAALQFVKDFYTPVVAGQQTFTGRKIK